MNSAGEKVTQLCNYCENSNKFVITVIIVSVVVIALVVVVVILFIIISVEYYRGL